MSGKYLFRFLAVLLGVVIVTAIIVVLLNPTRVLISVRGTDNGTDRMPGRAFQFSTSPRG